MQWTSTAHCPRAKHSHAQELSDRPSEPPNTPSMSITPARKRLSAADISLSKSTETAIGLTTKVVIQLAPFIMGDNFDIRKAFLRRVAGKSRRPRVLCQRLSVTVLCHYRQPVFMEQCGLDGNDVDFIHMSDEVRRALESHGIRNSAYIRPRPRRGKRESNSALRSTTCCPKAATRFPHHSHRRKAHEQPHGSHFQPRG